MSGVVLGAPKQNRASDNSDPERARLDVAAHLEPWWPVWTPLPQCGRLRRASEEK